MTATLHPIVAVDGTAASGKSTFSRALAQRLGFDYVNTGAMYRGVTWFLQQRQIDLADPGAVARAFAEVQLETGLYEGELTFRIAGTDPLPHVREPAINQGVSLVARVPEVRQRLVAEQQGLALLAPLVMEGRDIGTVVFPDSAYKFYVDADPAVRAERRSKQGETDVILQRDAMDQARIHSPLTHAPDALHLDSGRATVEEMVVRALAHLAARGLAAGETKS